MVVVVGGCVTGTIYIWSASEKALLHIWSGVGGKSVSSLCSGGWGFEREDEDDKAAGERSGVRKDGNDMRANRRRNEEFLSADKSGRVIVWNTHDLS